MATEDNDGQAYGDGRAERVRVLAELGAKTRLRELRNEEAQLIELFPSLANGNGNTSREHAEAGVVAAEIERRTHGIGGKPMETAGEAATPPVRKRKPLSPEMKKKIGKRMKKYWADRRAGLVAAPKR